jgi:hypothetical protein
VTYTQELWNSEGEFHIIKLYRYLAKKFGNPDEHPLGFQKIDYAGKLFSKIEYETLSIPPVNDLLGMWQWWQ